MDPLYQPHGVEERWQRLWEEEGLYAAGAGARRNETFVICVPPPNVTGSLHLGHALKADYLGYLRVGVLAGEHILARQQWP